jgi:hypothetical protein
MQNTAARLAIVHDRDLHQMLELIDAQHIPEVRCFAVSAFCVLTAL